ncbi:MAG: transglutaminase-like domain-containing protein [Hyphomicrobium sp.]
MAAAALAATVLAIHAVPDAATPEDRVYADRMLEAAGYVGQARDFGDLSQFENQLRAIAAVQDAVIEVAVTDAEIPFDRTREPRDAFELRKGLCYDRSRAIEKGLDALGLETRHVSVYAVDGRTALGALLTPGNDSHALTEVRTAKGWMAVDPNVRWVGRTADGEVLTVAGLRGLDLAAVRWEGGQSSPPHAIFSKPFVYILGLYSRHGRFYPPYTPVPDVNWRQLLQNFSG